MSPVTARTARGLLVGVLAGAVLASACDLPASSRARTASPSSDSASPSPAGTPAGSPAETPPEPIAWQRGPDAPLALTEVAAAAHDGAIWVAGGLSADGRAVTDVLVLDPVEKTWTRAPSLPVAVHHAALVSDGADLWLLGGYEGDAFDRPTDRILRLTGDAWAEDAPLPEPRAAGAAAWDGVGRLIYVVGVGPGGVRGSVHARDRDGWRLLGDLPEGREHTSAASDGEGHVFVLGGRRGGLDTNVATVELVEPDGGLRRLGTLPTPRGGVAAFWWPTLGACLAGGESPAGTNPQVECIDLNGRVTVLPSLARTRHGLGAAVVDGTAHVLLGGEQPGLFVSPIVEALVLQ